VDHLPETNLIQHEPSKCPRPPTSAVGNTKHDHALLKSIAPDKEPRNCLTFADCSIECRRLSRTQRKPSQRHHLTHSFLARSTLASWLASFLFSIVQYQDRRSLGLSCKRPVPSSSNPGSTWPAWSWHFAQLSSPRTA
jgi:hypothetical protein